MASAYPGQLPPLAQPIAQFSSTIARGTEMIILREKLFAMASESMEITNMHGQPLLMVKGRYATVSGRKMVYDIVGNHLFDLYREHMHLHVTFVAETVGKHKFLEVKSAIKVFGSKAACTFTAPDGRQHILTLRGNWRDYQAEIVLGEGRDGPVVGRIHRDFFNKQDFWAGQQRYAVTVAPGMDMALMMAICMALEEKNSED